MPLLELEGRQGLDLLLELDRMRGLGPFIYLDGRHGLSPLLEMERMRWFGLSGS